MKTCLFHIHILGRFVCKLTGSLFDLHGPSLRGPVRPTQVSIRTKFIFAVVKYQRLRGASQNQAFSKMDQWL